MDSTQPAPTPPTSPPPPPTAEVPPPPPVAPVTPIPPADTAINTSPPKGNGKKILLLLIIIVVILTLISGVAFVATRKPAPTPSPTPILTPAPQKAPDEMSDFTSAIAIKENTVQVAKSAGKYCLRYKGKIYLPQETDSYDPKEAKPENPESYTWYGLVDPPSDLDISNPEKDQVFGFKSYPDNNGFIFIMRWPNKTGESYQIFNFGQNNVSPVVSFSPTATELAYRVPKIHQLSPSGTLAALHMFDCWECEREYPQTLLLNAVSKQTKVVGQTSYFNWKTDGEYEYKEYIKDRPMNEIPIKIGQFSF